MFFFMILAGFAKTHADEKDENFLSRFVLEGGIGCSKNADLRGTDENLHGYGITGILRIKWEASKRFGMGLESGYIHLASQSENNLRTNIGITSLDMKMFAIPVILFMSLEAENLQLNAGAGIYNVFSDINAYGEKSSSSMYDYGYMLSLAYYYPIYTNLGLSAQAKWNYLSDMKTSTFSGMLNLYYYLF